MYKLVIADDDSLTLKSFVSGYDWEAMGFRIVASFSSSEDCLIYLRKHHVHALLTDIRMPNLSGLDLARICSDAFPNLGIVLLSSYSNFKYAHQAIKYNVIDYLLKPVDVDDLTTAMNKLKHFLDKTALSAKNNEEADSTILHIKEFIEAHLKENITINDVADHVMINPKYFGSYFKKQTGETFSNYLQKIRIKKASELLKNTELKINTIAEMVSYKTTTAFFKYFYEQYQMTPLEYRKKYKNNK